MAATKKSNGVIYLPADLVIEILSKLPVKSIIRFNCVAKNWYNLFKNPTFVSQHLRLGEKNSSPSLLISYWDEISDARKIGLMTFGDDKTFVSYHDLHQQLPCHVADNINHSSIDLTVGDGLVCLYDVLMGSGNMALWNPATKEFRILPDCNLNIPPREDSPWVSYYVGCGIDPLSNDYKVLCIRQEYTNYKRYDHYAIYTMSNDSWRVLKKEQVQLVEDPDFIPNKSNVCANGVCYWQVGDTDPYGCKLLKFHLDTEVFQLMESPIPGSAYGELMPLPDGRIAFWDCMPDIVSDQCGIWVLNDEGNYWPKLININLPVGIQRIHDVWRHVAETKLAEFNEDQVETREFIYDLGIDPDFFHCCPYTYCTYEESLLSVGSCKYIDS